MGKVLSQTDTSIYNLANLNPFRYRGYVYDNETGLYYLQSRYYDSITGRFLNADSYVDTGNSVLSTNMFAYCENNAIMKIDSNGEDAYWLQDINAVWGAGHTSLLIQDKSGKWWYFYWGDKDIQLLYFGSGTLNDLNRFLHGKNKWKYNFYKGNSYTHWDKIKGSFSGCLEYIFFGLMYRSKPAKIGSYSFAYCIKNFNNRYYSFNKNNCVQVSIKVLLKGNFTGKKSTVDSFKRALLKIVKSWTIPNQVYGYLQKNYFFAI